MPETNPDRILDKFRRLHQRLKGSGATVSILKYTNTVVDDHALPSASSTAQLTPDPQPIIEDQPGEDLLKAFGGSISPDERIFRFVSDTLVTRNPTSTLEQRAWDFLAERTGQTKGAIQYGSTLYTIMQVVVGPIIGGVPAWLTVRARAQKRKT